MTDPRHDEALRFECLKFAAASAIGGAQPEELVRAAGLFFSYINGPAPSIVMPSGLVTQ